jgi:nicotinate-nucleotide--dimethylbenzimidazole phosphoribosyltransferase
MFDRVAKPVGSLGKLEDLVARIYAIRGSADISRKCVVVFLADNGVVCEGVANGGPEVTTAIARMMSAGRSCVCVMAERCGADVFCVDVGMRDTVEGVENRKLMNGTGNIAEGAAMSREACERAIRAGIDAVGERRGYHVIAVGETGIGNTTTASAMASVLLGRPVLEVTGRGAGLSDEGLARKRGAIERAISVNRPLADDPIDVLAKLGGLDIAAMTGAYLGGVKYGVPMVVDGVVSCVAALTAARIEPAVAEYLIPSHISAEPAGVLLTRALGFEPILDAGMRLGEGTGAVALFPLLDMAAAVLTGAATFDDIAVGGYDGYEPAEATGAGPVAAPESPGNPTAPERPPNKSDKPGKEGGRGR